MSDELRQFVYPQEVEWTNVTKHDVGESVDVTDASELLVENAFKSTAEINSPGALGQLY
jgi:hypothetical protein